MKKLITLFLLTFSIGVFGQVQDLRELSTGKIVFWSSLSDKKSDLYGYFFVYSLDQIDNETTEYEYVLLDKNLNPTLNFKHQDKTYKNVWREFSDATYLGDHISLSSNPRSGNKGQAMYNTVQLISLKEKKVVNEFYFDFDLVRVSEEGSIKKLYKDHKEYYDQLRSELHGINHEGFTGLFGYLMSTGSSALFSTKGDSVWDYWPGSYTEFSPKLYEKNLFVGHQVSKQKKKDDYYQDIKIFDIDADGQCADYRLEDGKSEHLFTVNKVALYEEDKIQVFGYYAKANRNRIFYRILGIYRVVLDEKGNELAKTFFKWEELGEDMEINEKGKTKGNYRLVTKQFFTFANGSSAILFEKFKMGAQTGSKLKVSTSDMVLVQFDKDFKLQKMHLIEKAKTRSKHATTDYLFSQYLNDKNDVVFFFADKKEVEDSRKKEWILGINKIIDGTYSYEELPMTSEEFDRSISRAKEGYILIHEIDKSDDKGKYEIRLEKLNL